MTRPPDGERHNRLRRCRRFVLRHLTGYRVHCCPLDRDCQKIGGLARLYFFSPYGHIAFALNPDNRFVDAHLVDGRLEYRSISWVWTARKHRSLK